jgi:lysophospholipase L1-like esterase
MTASASPSQLAGMCFAAGELTDMKRNLLWSAILFCLSTALAIAAAEAVLRIKNSSMTNYDIEMWRYAKELKVPSQDPKLGHEHIKNASALLQSVDIRINEWGLRGGPVAARDPNIRRILVLGGSITLGWGVPEQETMTAQLASMFANSSQKVEVLNAGVGNYNAERYVELFLRDLSDLQPSDIVVHYFVRDAEKLDPGGGNVALRNSQLAVTFWIAATRLLGKTGERSLVDHYSDVYAESNPGFRAMQASLRKLADYAKAKGIRLYLAMTPDVHNLAHYEFGFIHEIMRGIAARLGYVYIDLLPAFGTLSPEQVWAMPGDPHPNALGHELMAKALYPILAEARD